MSIHQVPGTEISYYMASFDKDGGERQDDPDGLMSDRIAKVIREEPLTDVFVMSHGWKGDIPAAREQYDLWAKAMADCASDREQIRQLRPGFKSLIVGFHWPSQPWGEEEFGMGAASFAAPGAPAAASSAAPPVDVMVDQYADRIADTPQARAAIRTIVTHAMTAGPGVNTLPPDIVEAYRVLNDEAGIAGEGPAAAEGNDREPFDPQRAYRNARMSATKLAPGVPSFGGFSLSGVLSPLRQLSFWQMKNRGRKLGETAGFNLLKSMMEAVPPGRNVRFHLMGHSFGCIVVASMIHGPNGTGVLPGPVSSLTLVQGATSLWGFCNVIPDVNKPGYFRRIIDENKVSGPIVTTQSKRDTAVGRFYPVAAGVALQTDFAAGHFPKYGGLGAFGIQGPGLNLHDLAIADAAHDYGFQPQHVYNLECTGVITDGSGASGAHSDIAKPEVAHAMWEAVKGT